MMADGRCDTCKADKVCDHDRFGFENCDNYISEDCAEVVYCKDCIYARELTRIANSTENTTSIVPCGEVTKRKMCGTSTKNTTRTTALLKLGDFVPTENGKAVQKNDRMD